MKMPKLQLLATRFEDLRMMEFETIVEYNAKICDIANEAFALGEKYSETKLMMNVLLSLAQRKAKEFNAINVKVSSTFNSSVQIPSRKRVNHSIPLGVVRNLKTVAIPPVTSDTVATPAATSSTIVTEIDDSGSDCNSDDDLNDEDIQKKDILKRAMINYEFLAAEKEMKLQETKLQLENTQKSLKMLNFGIAKLDHILSIGKSSRDHHGLGYTGDSSSSKIVFVRGTSIHELNPQSGY
ncbi:hypothetical protein TIFTF001_028927 [Ficus carica]|uniref:Uncharacterized protein n=1 Tax=Ficus carica TaxID=3494 RepID=A0AA88DQX0_FICCA|nr:hypothetical protein TIFTF001_028927 [Ficus carica]